ncbi:Protein F33D4.6 b [Aphelenchoides avenae]|nr:Protein F33D4.6 b [Aphelenchus avenae]
MATVSVPKPPPVTEAPSMESSMDDDNDDTKRVTEEASHRVLKTVETHQLSAPRSYSRQYSLKELEEIINGAKDRSDESESFYRRQKETKIDMSNPESTGEKLQRPRRLTIHPMDNAYSPEKEQTRSEGPVVQKRSRIEELRRKFANDRRMIAEKTKRMFRHDVAKAESHSGVTEQHCQNIRSFARQFGTLDVRAFAHNNCRFIENYYPDLKCTKVSEYMTECSKYLRF